MKKILIVFSILLLSSCSSTNIEDKNPKNSSLDTQNNETEDISMPGKDLVSKHSEENFSIIPVQ
jgi:PBP1b-binding outer membrane lipoprotein LpoB